MAVGSSPFADLLRAAGHAESSAVEVSSPLNAADVAHLTRALDEARRGVGRTAPNPPVGAVVARGDDVLAAGFHARAGDRHAEVVAFDALPPGAARGATLYVTLEPCVHHGKTPPCVDRVLVEGVARVVVGTVDPNPRVCGNGIAALRAAGVVVDVAHGTLGDACHALVAPFESAVIRQRPWVILKVATSLDGRVAAAGGASRWITGPRARSLVHGLRDAVDAVLVGAGTVRADDPVLTVRAPVTSVAREPRNPARIVIDGALVTRPDARVYARGTGAAPLVIHGCAPDDRVRAFDSAGIARRAVPIASAEGARVDLHAALRSLAPAALAVLVEAGPGLGTALLQQGLVDELWWFTAPCLLGADAVPAVGALGVTSPEHAPRGRLLHRVLLDDDVLQIFGLSSDARR